ncbi:hypothetical protein [Modestobacter excelsi]|uniref:hypothetical protein n=1 Tax=Modestobacter excelsi TaxID=2213161 RepID=UPI00110CDB58|nr:hypothetical protein [Modestobacter excelsi]
MIRSLALQETPVGVGVLEVARRKLSDEDMELLVRAAIDERQTAARGYEQAASTRAVGDCAMGSTRPPPSPHCPTHPRRRRTTEPNDLTADIAAAFIRGLINVTPSCLKSVHLLRVRYDSTGTRRGRRSDGAPCEGLAGGNTCAGHDLDQSWEAGMARAHDDGP